VFLGFWGLNFVLVVGLSGFAQPRVDVKYVVVRRDGSRRVIHGYGGLTANFKGAIVAMFKNTTVNLIRTDGSAVPFKPFVGAGDDTLIAVLDVFALKENDGYGIVVGTGSKPFSFGDYSLESKIPHGSGMGQLYYYEVKEETLSEEEAAYRYAFSRRFDNQSSQPIDVKESGVIARYVHGTVGAGFILIARDVPALPVRLEPQDYLVVIYTFELAL